MTVESEKSVPETVQTGQEEEPVGNNREPYIELAQDDEGKWNWCLWSGNGRIIAMNGDNYNDKKGAQAAIRVLKDLLSKPLKMVARS